MPARVVACDELGVWLLKHIDDQYPSIRNFVGSTYKPPSKVGGKYQYIVRVLKRASIVPGQTFFYEMCNNLKISKKEQEVGLKLLDERRARVSAFKQRDIDWENSEIPPTLFKALLTLDRTITLGDIHAIMKILTRLGEQFLNEIIIEQIVAKYFENQERETT